MTTGQSLADGAAGHALAHLERRDWPAAYAALRLAVADGVSTGDGASLYHGAPALAFVLAATTHPGLAQARAVTTAGTATITRRRLATAHRRIDRHQRPHYAEYDLIRGLTGLGVVLRRTGDTDLLRQVLEYLVRLTEPVNGLPGWWCHNAAERRQPAPAGGHANHGLAHGIAGPLALLALALADNITVDGHTEAIACICGWLDQWAQNTNGATWWPQILTRADLDHGVPAQPAPLRPSWCYGTPGIVRAQQLAAIAVGDTTRQRRVEAAFTSCISDPRQVALLTDRGLCHGTAGLLATARRITADALTPMPLPLIEDLPRPAAAGDQPGGFLDGTAGVDLVTAGTTDTRWDASLLLA